MTITNIFRKLRAFSIILYTDTALGKLERPSNLGAFAAEVDTGAGKISRVGNVMDFNALLTTFANNLLPILLVSGAGFLLGKALDIDSRSLGRVVFYVFSPILVFNLLLHTELSSGEILVTVGYTVAVCLIVGVLALLSGKLLHFERPVLMALIITAAFGNTGNYGLPLVSFAFGKDALAFATLNFVTSVVLFNTAGVLLASLGHMDFKAAAAGVFKVPAVYGVLLAGLLNRFHIVLPTSLERTIDLAANGSIPVMIILLGLELSRVKWSGSLQAVGFSTVLRLLAGPGGGLPAGRAVRDAGAGAAGERDRVRDAGGGDEHGAGDGIRAG